MLNLNVVFHSLTIGKHASPWDIALGICRFRAFMKNIINGYDDILYNLATKTIIKSFVLTTHTIIKRLIMDRLCLHLNDSKTQVIVVGSTTVRLFLQ